MYAQETMKPRIADEQHEGKLGERMREYIENRLNLSEAESEKFNPLFKQYFQEFTQTHRQNKADKLIMQQKIVELRLRYRDQFKQILDVQRANQVFKYEDDFRKEAIKIIRENRGEKGDNNRQGGGLKRN